MRILQIVNNGHEAGGAEKSVKLIKDELSKQGHYVLVVSTDKNAANKLLFADVMVPAIKGNFFERLIDHAWNSSGYSKIKEIIKSFNPDVIHLHTINEFSPSVFWAIGDKPTLMTVHGPEEFTVSLLPWLLPPSDYRLNSYKIKDLTVKGQLRYSYYRYLQSPIYRMGAKHLKTFIAPSKFIEDVLKIELPKATIKQIYNGINLPEQMPILDRDAQNLLYVGRLESVKGVDYLLIAFAEVIKQYPKATLTIVGDGQQFASLRELAVHLQVQHSVSFTGWLTAEETTAMYGKSAVVIIPSIWPENLPTVGIEALAVGRAIIGTNTGGISELIDNNVNGLLVPLRDSTGLSRAVEMLFDKPETIHRMGQASHEKSSQFGLKHFTEQLVNLYNEIK